jgi:hypothetical protein
MATESFTGASAVLGDGYFLLLLLSLFCIIDGHVCNDTMWEGSRRLLQRLIPHSRLTVALLTFLMTGDVWWMWYIDTVGGGVADVHLAPLDSHRRDALREGVTTRKLLMV